MEKAQAIAERFARVGVGGPGARADAARRLQPLFNSLVLRDFTSDGDRLTLPGMTAGAHPQRASARRRRADRLRARRRPVSRCRGRQDAELSRARATSSAWGSPASRASSCRITCSSSSAASSCSSTRKPGSWPPPAMTSLARSAGCSSPRSPPTTGTRSSSPARVLADPDRPSPRRPTSRTGRSRPEVAPTPRATAIAAPSEIQKLLALENRLKSCPTRAAIRGLLRGHRDRLPARRRGAPVQEPRHRVQHRATPRSRAQARHRPAHEARVPALAEGERVTTFATATPIANSITEAYVMQRYLRPDLFEDASIHHFDAWAATFGSASRAGDGPDGRQQLPHQDAVREVLATSPRCCACGRSSPTSRPPRTCAYQPRIWLRARTGSALPHRRDAAARRD